MANKKIGNKVTVLDMEDESNWNKTVGTSMKGYIYIDYDRLVEALGDAEGAGDRCKTERQWVLEFKNGDIITIYDYKQSIEYLGEEDGLDVEDIVEWHVGGKNKLAFYHMAFFKKIGGHLTKDDWRKSKQK